MVGTDEETFNSILAHRSPGQLRLTFREYSAMAGRTIEEAIAAEFSGIMQDALLTIGTYSHT
jgi:annexin A7/11